MHDIRSLLQDIDPLRREPARFDMERERIRRAIVAAAPALPVRTRRWSLSLVAAIALAAIGLGVIGYQLWLRAATPVAAAIRFEVRLAERDPAPGLVAAQVAGSDQLVYLHPEAVIRNQDIAESAVEPDVSGTFNVIVKLSPTGAARMREATAAHIGRPLALLVGDVVVMAPVLRSPIDESAVINGGYSESEARRIADGIFGL